MRTSRVLVAVAALATTACSSSDHGSSSGALEAPMLMEIMTMPEGLHLMWMNMQKDCDSVEAERRTDQTDYELAFVVPGSADNKMDTAATENLLYTYRMRCKKADTYSTYSNELSANPYEM